MIGSVFVTAKCSLPVNELAEANNLACSHFAKLKQIAWKWMYVGSWK